MIRFVFHLVILVDSDPRQSLFICVLRFAAETHANGDACYIVETPAASEKITFDSLYD